MRESHGQRRVAPSVLKVIHQQIPSRFAQRHATRDDFANLLGDLREMKRLDDVPSGTGLDQIEELTFIRMPRDHDHEDLRARSPELV